MFVKRGADRLVLGVVTGIGAFSTPHINAHLFRDDIQMLFDNLDVYTREFQKRLDL